LSIFMDFGIPKVAKAPSRWPRACLVVSPVWTEAKRTPEYVPTVTWIYFKMPHWGIWVTSVCQIWFALRPQGLMPVLGPKVRRVLQVGQALITRLHWSWVKVGNFLCNMLVLWCSKEWLCKACWKMEEEFWDSQQQWRRWACLLLDSSPW
jgi:hypothetical protein